MAEKDWVERFIKVYSNIPLAERANPVVVLKKYGPISWERAYKEIKNETAVGKEIAQKLIGLKII